MKSMAMLISHRLFFAVRFRMNGLYPNLEGFMAPVITTRIDVGNRKLAEEWKNVIAILYGISHRF